MQKALTKMNVQLANVISDISGVTGQAIIHAILRGERDPYVLADLSDPHIQASREEIAQTLEGTWREDVLFELQQAVDSYDFFQKQIAACDAQLQMRLAVLPNGKAREAGAAPAGGKKERSEKLPKNQPQFDLRTELHRICGVDLTRIDGSM